MVRPPINQGLVFRSNTVQNLWISMSWFLEQVIWHEFSLIPLIKHKWSNLLFGYISRIGLRSSATNTGKHEFTIHPSSYNAILLIFWSWCYCWCCSLFFYPLDNHKVGHSGCCTSYQRFPLAHPQSKRGKILKMKRKKMAKMFIIFLSVCQRLHCWPF